MEKRKYIMTQEHKDKISKALRGNKNALGYKQSKEQVQHRINLMTGVSRSKETKNKISETRKKRISEGKIIPWNLGKKNSQIAWNKGLTKETDSRVKQYAEKLIGKTPSEETRQKISKTLTGRKLKPFTDEHKRKIGVKHKGKVLSDKTKQKLREARLKQVFPTKNTSIEIALQNELNDRNIEYETHIPLCKVCIPDIVFKDKKLAVFADGDYWHSIESAIKRDNNQNKILKENGWNVLRFWGHEIRENVVECVNQITKFL